jgi:general secretion pathway protein K
MTVTGRVEANIARNLRTDEEVQSRLDGAVFEAAFHVLAQGGQHWEPDGGWWTLGSRDHRIAVRVSDPSALINLNTATLPLLRALLREMGGGETGAVADEIVAWREKGDEVDPKSLKLRRYAAAGRLYGPPEAPFRSVDELGMVLGVTPEMLARLKPHVTVHSAYGPVRDTRDVIVRKALLRVMHEGGELPDDQNYERSRVLAITAIVLGSGTTGPARQAVLKISLADRDQPCTILAWDRTYTDEDSQE